MPETAEEVARVDGFTREEADAFALRSHQQAIAAIGEGRLADEIIAVQTRGGAVSVDEQPRRDTTLEKRRSTPSTSPSGARSRISRPRSSQGLPTLIRPATPTGYVAELMVRIFAGSGLVPAGAIRLGSGSSRAVRAQRATRGRAGGIAARSCCVYGCSGRPKSSAAGRCSTAWPSRSTSTSWLISCTIARSWAMNR